MMKKGRFSLPAWRNTTERMPKTKKKSKVKAVEETVREEIPREEVRVPEEKKELKFDLYVHPKKQLPQSPS